VPATFLATLIDAPILNVLTIRIPPLRERLDDIPLLVTYFLGRMNREFDRRVHGVSPEAMQLLKQHNWPGTVRELQSAIKHALIHSYLSYFWTRFFLQLA